MNCRAGNLRQKQNTGYCQICGKEIGKNRKSCSPEHAKQLRIATFSQRVKLTHKCGGLRSGSGRGKKGWYKGYYCDSSWELAWVIYQLDHGCEFKRYTGWFPYVFNGQKKKYYPDFLMSDGTFVEIKGYDCAEWQAKLRDFPKHLKLNVLYQNDLTDVFTYVKAKYGNDWTKLYDNSKLVLNKEQDSADTQVT